jgi:ketosteroid isomerase-like protein
MAGEKEIEIARALFGAWSSGEADAPARYLTDDAVLYDVVEGSEKVGWPAIRVFFANSLKIFPDLVLAPIDFWTNDRGVALSWKLTSTLRKETFGPDHEGKQFESDGMSSLEFRDGKVCREVDYHHGGALQRALGIKK